MIRVLVLVVAATAIACGGSSPTAPTPTPVQNTPPAPSSPPTAANIAGTWKGVFAFLNSDGAARQFPIAVTLQQHEGQVTGRWTDQDDPDFAYGEIAGTLSGFGAATQLAGTMTWDSDTASGTGRCLGRMSVAGPVTTSFLRWTAERLVFDTCRGAWTNIVVTLAR